MNDPKIHPIIRYGGPVLGAILVYFLLSTMVDGFRADQEAARLSQSEVVETEEAGVVAEPAASSALTSTTSLTSTTELTATTRSQRPAS